jgi:dCTP deaminase
LILSDYDLENAIKSKLLVITPFKKDNIRENGLDLRLADEIGFHNPDLGKEFILDPSNSSHLKKEYIMKKNIKNLIVPSKEMVLLSTIEKISLPNNLMSFVELRSTWARHGLSMPPTIIDAGFSGTVTLEVINNTPHAILLHPGVRFAHFIFAKTLNNVVDAYKGNYMGQSGIHLPKLIKKSEY